MFKTKSLQVIAITSLRKLTEFHESYHSLVSHPVTKPRHRIGNRTQICCVWVVASLISLLHEVPAEAAKIFFSINDATSGSLYKESGDFACNSSTHILDISGTYSVSGGTFTISPISTGTARVACNEADDILRVENAKFTYVSGTVSNVKITIWRTYTSSTTGLVTYSVFANGTFLGTPSGSSLSLRGYVNTTSLGGLADPSNPPSCNMALLTKCPSSSPGTWAFTSSNFQRSSSISPPSTRKLTVKFWLALGSGAILQVDNMTVKYGPPI